MHAADLQPAQPQPFVGRATELDQLIRCWQTAKRGMPQLALITGDSGLGKTRLVQELYAWLREHEDPNQYWPAFLPSDRNSLAVAPPLSSANAQGNLPWFWWGLRCPNPTDRHAIDCDAVLAGGRQIEFHLNALARAKVKQNDDIALFKSVLSVLGDLAVGIATGGSTLIGPGMLITVWDMVLAAATKYSHSRADQDGTKGQVFSKRQQIELVDRLLVLLREILTAKSNTTQHIPVIIIVDDAMWADASIIELIRRILEEGTVRRWPVLIVCTTWEHKLREQMLRCDSTTLGGLVDDLQRRRYLDHGAAGIVNEIELSVLESSLALLLVSEALPALDEEQALEIAHKSGGNPLLLWELSGLA